METLTPQPSQEATPALKLRAEKIPGRAEGSKGGKRRPRRPPLPSPDPEAARRADSGTTAQSPSLEPRRGPGSVAGHTEGAHLPTDLSAETRPPRVPRGFQSRALASRLYIPRRPRPPPPQHVTRGPDPERPQAPPEGRAPSGVGALPGGWRRRPVRRRARRFCKRRWRCRRADEP